MKVFTCTGFQGHWPVGTSAVVIARTISTARWALMEELKRVGLEQQIALVDMHEISLTTPSVRVLNDGNY